MSNGLDEFYGTDPSWDASRPGNEAVFHQGGVDRIDQAYDAIHGNLLAGVIGYDPADLLAPSLDTRQDIEELPQWGPPFVKFVDGRLSELEKKVIKEIEKWQFQTVTDFFMGGAQTTSSGGLDTSTTPNCQIYQAPPGFTFALHRLAIIVPSIIGTFAAPFPGIGTGFEASGSTAAAPPAGTTIATLNVVNPGVYQITTQTWESGTPDANLENAQLNVNGANVGGTLPTTNAPTSITQQVTVSGNPIIVKTGVAAGGAGAVYNAIITATLVSSTGYYEIRVNNEAIDGGPLSLPTVRTWGTRDAPRVRDGEVLSIFMSNGPINARMIFKGQGSRDRTIEG